MRCYTAAAAVPLLLLQRLAGQQAEVMRKETTTRRSTGRGVAAGTKETTARARARLNDDPSLCELTMYT